MIDKTKESQMTITTPGEAIEQVGPKAIRLSKSAFRSRRQQRNRHAAEDWSYFMQRKIGRTS